MPRRVREIRRQYSFLTKELFKRGVNYRWLVPEGLLFTWQEQRQRVDTVQKAELFYLEFFRGKEEDTQKEESLIEFQEEYVAVIEKEKEESVVDGVPREQREVRSTRATKPSYKA